ncbi:MAG: M1 family aminopeptidase [Bacteroidaceae bacterium]|nr:M1 family aminopeptidase [Bacteroidaceae bacterium]
MKKIFLSLIICFLVLQSNAQNDSIDIQHYDINLDINNLIKGKHKGYCIVRAKVVNPTSRIIRLNLLNHNVDSVYLNGAPTIYSYLSPNLDVSLPAYVQNNEEVEVCVWYSGAQVIELYGWGGIHYNPEIIYSLNVAIMDAQHSFARSWFPAQDYFSDKATFNLNITTHNSRKAICGGMLDSISVVSDSSSSWHWRITQTIAPYLVAVTIADYCLVEDTIQGIAKNFPLQIYCFPADSSTIRGKIDLIKDAFHALENNFGEFRFNRVGYCVTPLGSMEHVDNISLAYSAAVGQGDGNNSNIVHELGHSWFGNYMGGESELNMWIKEGWTSWSENISFEGHYGKEHAKNYFRNNMEMVLNKMPIDEGYRILYGVTGADVYSTTTYRKGAAVVHTLRGYLGDSIFFPAVCSMLNNYGYGIINTFQMRDYLSSVTNIDLNDFFNFYVLDSGYNHYSISNKIFNGNIATITINQRTVANLNGGCQTSRVPVTFIDANWNKEKRIIEFNSSTSTQNINLNINPINCFVDLEEEIADATIDNYKNISGVGRQDFSNTYFYANVKNNPDSILLRTTLHWVGNEDEKPLPNGIKRISKKHYWTIEGEGIENCEIEGNFFYKILAGANNFDNELVNKYSGLDSLILLYRPNQDSNWIAVRTSRPTNTEGYLTLNSLWKGDYIMGVGDVNTIGLAAVNQNSPQMKVYPNPAKESINVNFIELNQDFDLFISDNSGKVLYSDKVKKGTTQIKIKNNLSSGLYLLRLVSEDKTSHLRDKIIIIK